MPLSFLDSGSAAGVPLEDPWVSWVLDLARNRLGTDIAWVSEFTGTDQLIAAATGNLAAMNVTVGMTAPLEGSFCARVLAGQIPPVVTAAGRDPRTRDLPITAALHIGSYVGAPIRAADGAPVGMLCCLGRDDGVQLDEGSARFLAFLADLVGQHLTGVRSRVSASVSVQELAEAHSRVDRILAARSVQPVFQPVVEVSTGRVVAFEALTRFTGAETATVFSDAAGTGRGLELEELAARAALAAATARPIDVTVWLNLSPQALLHPPVLDLVLGGAGQRIGVEVTEHAPVEDYVALLEVRRQLRAAGVLLSIDDAGAGYASFRHILSLEPDVIKLDASLISGVHLDRGKQALVTAMQAFATGIGAVVVAEGVEEPAERDALADRGIPYGQGWLWGHPRPFDCHAQPPQ